jgi:hypothetical protein
MEINVNMRSSQTGLFVSCPCRGAGFIGSWWHGNAIEASLGGVDRG